MASTNKTTNYELSQFLGSDKPAWLADYNADMSKIDAQMKLNADSATAAEGSASTANTNIGTLASLTTDAKTSLVAAVNEVDSHADTAQNTANTAGTNANQALSSISTLNNYLNIGANNETIPLSNMSISGVGTLRASSELHIVGNTDNSLIKIYGDIFVDGVSRNSTVTVTVTGTSLRPTDSITINSCGFVSKETAADGVKYVDPLSYTIAPNGTITITAQTGPADTLGLKFLACIVFVKNFGD